MKKLISASLILYLLATMIACSGETINETAKGTEVVLETEIETETGLGVSYSVQDLEGQEIQIYNATRQWDMNVPILVNEDSEGDYALNTALHARNVKVEEMFNCKLVEYGIESGPDYFSKLISTARQLISSGDTTYDCMYLPISLCSNLILEGGMYDLNTVSTLQLEEEWWDQLIIEAADLGGKTYFATSCAQMMPFDCSWCIYFNEDMAADYNITSPYEMVDKGTWTLDALYTLASQATIPNADGTYTWQPDGEAIYGICGHSHATEKLLIASGCRYVQKEEDSWAVIPEIEKFINVVSEIAQITADEAAWHNGNDADQLSNLSEGGYVAIFGARRSLFLTGEVKTAQILREMDDTFGIVPMPKGSEAQSTYYTPVARDFLQFTIPVTNGEPEIVGTVLDALSYESYMSILPVYYDITVSQKGLRNEESIRMLDYIRQGRTVDIGMLFGWTKTLNEQIVAKMWNGSSDVTSVIAAHRTATEEKIAEFAEFCKK